MVKAGLTDFCPSLILSSITSCLGQDSHPLHHHPVQDVNEAGHMSGAGFIWQPAISQRAGLCPVARHVFMLILSLQNHPPLPS